MMNGRCCLSTIIRGTSVGEDSWKIDGDWRPMWHGPIVKVAARQNWVQLFYPACCVVVDVDGKCKLFIAAAAARVHFDMSVRVIGETADQATALRWAGLRLDRAVVQSVLTAIQPAGIEAAIQLAACAKVRRR